MTTIESLRSRSECVAVVGLGYVGLPLAAALSRYFRVLGFDVSSERIQELSSGFDRTGEVESSVLKEIEIEYSADPKDLSRAGLIIVAVPTPIDEHRNPDLNPVCSASATVGENMKKGSVVVYESTVYPGLTEEVCAPILEERSGLACGQDFWIGYSPERINPGDKVHTLETIVKIVAGQNQAVTDLLAEVYGAVVKAGIHRASSIKVAEAAKVIENTQRDLNIALMNELSLIFSRLDIDTIEVLEAAGTKWNFLPFRPGLVGGHCIGVDPYYLTFKALSLGFQPQIILAGRRINDSMGKYVAETAVKLMSKCGCSAAEAKVGVMGLTFKEDVPDLRNTKVIDVVRELREFGAQVLVHDPLADPAEAEREYGLKLCGLDEFKELDAAVLAVAHKQYAKIGLKEMRPWFKAGSKPLIVDIKGRFEAKEAEAAGFAHWRL